MNRIKTTFLFTALILCANTNIFAGPAEVKRASELLNEATLKQISTKSEAIVKNLERKIADIEKLTAKAPDQWDEDAVGDLEALINGIKGILKI